MKRFLILLLIMFCFASLSSAKNLTEEVHDSIINMTLQGYNIVSKYPPYEVTHIGPDSVEYTNHPQKYFRTYDLMVDSIKPYEEEFDYDFGLYKICEMLWSSSRPYYILFWKGKYWIYYWNDKKLLRQVRKFLKKADVSTEKKEKILNNINETIAIFRGSLR